MTAKSASPKAEKEKLPSKTKEAKIVGILVTDPSQGPEARGAYPNLIWSRPSAKGEELFFHTNPHESYLPHAMGSKPFRRLLDNVKLETYGVKKEKVEKADKAEE